MPWGNPYISNTGIKRSSKQYDSYPAIAAQGFVDTMMKFTPQDAKFVHLYPGELLKYKIMESENEQAEELYKQWEEHLDAESDILHAYRLRSNFHTIVQPFWWDYGMGTGIMMIEEGDTEDPLKYRHIPLSEASISEDAYGDVNGLYQKLKISKDHLDQRFPQASKVSKKKAQDEIDLIMAICRIPMSNQWQLKLLLSNDIIFEKIYNTQPFFAPRWIKIEKSALGVGPFILAMPDYRTMNKHTELHLKGLALSTIRPMLVKNDRALNQNVIRLAPGQPINVESNRLDDPDIRMLDIGGTSPESEVSHQKWQENLKRIMLDRKLPSEHGAVRSAYELSIRMKETQVDIGMVYWRLVYEMVMPMVKRERDILINQGILEVPDFIREQSNTVDNRIISLEITSPLAKHQKAAELQEIIQYAQIIRDVAPDKFRTHFDTDQLIAEITELANFPARLWRDSDEVARLLKASQQLMQREQQQQQQQGPAPTPDNDRERI